MQNVTTLNSDCQLLTEPINLKPTAATPAKLEILEEVSLWKLSWLSAAPNRKNQRVSSSVFQRLPIIIVVVGFTLMFMWQTTHSIQFYSILYVSLVLVSSREGLFHSCFLWRGPFPDIDLASRDVSGSEGNEWQLRCLAPGQVVAVT